MIRIKPVYALACVGLALAAISAWVLNEQGSAQPPLFAPPSNPYANGIYALGMVESLQNQGADIALNPQVSATVTKVLVREGQVVHAGEPLLQLDDRVQRATAEQLSAQTEAAVSALAELHAQPRPETLTIAAAQVDNAAATHKSAADTLAKQEQAFAIDPRSVSRDTLDTARNAEAIAATALKVAQRNYALIHAGAWSYDIVNQQHLVEVAAKARDAARVQLGNYVLRMPEDGIVLAINATVGSYASPQGVFDPRTQAVLPVATVGTPQARMQVRAYVDEILVPRLARSGQIVAVMTPRGTTQHIPLRFERVQPYVSPKIELSDQRQERVDVRVLPVVFSFDRPRDLPIYAGQQVDIYIGGGK